MSSVEDSKQALDTEDGTVRVFLDKNVQFFESQKFPEGSVVQNIMQSILDTYKTVQDLLDENILNARLSATQTATLDHIILSNATRIAIKRFNDKNYTESRHSLPFDIVQFLRGLPNDE